MFVIFDEENETVILPEVTRDWVVVYGNPSEKADHFNSMTPEEQEVYDNLLDTIQFMKLEYPVGNEPNFWRMTPGTLDRIVDAGWPVEGIEEGKYTILGLPVFLKNWLAKFHPTKNPESLDTVELGLAVPFGPRFHMRVDDSGRVHPKNASRDPGSDPNVVKQGP